MNRILVSTLALLSVLVLANPAHAQESTRPKPFPTSRPLVSPARTPRFSSDFAFLVPGKTTIEEAEKTLGAVRSFYASYLVDDMVVLEPSPVNLVELYEIAGDRTVGRVDVRKFSAREDGNGTAYLAFKQGVLLYAHFPVSTSENSREKIAERYGKKLEVWVVKSTPTRQVLYSPHLLYVPGETSFFYWEADDGPVRLKFIVSPEAKVAGFERGDVRKPRAVPAD